MQIFVYFRQTNYQQVANLEDFVLIELRSTGKAYSFSSKYRGNLGMFESLLFLLQENVCDPNPCATGENCSIICGTKQYECTPAIAEPDIPSLAVSETITSQLPKITSSSSSANATTQLTSPLCMLRNTKYLGIDHEY